MTTYKISEKWPSKDQYCFIKNRDEWIFCIYQGTEEEIDKWGFFRNPALFNLGIIEEWQPAIIQLDNPVVDVLTKKAHYDLVDVKNDEGVSFWDAFKNTIGEPNDNSPRANSSSESGRDDIQTEIPVLRADSIESAK
jgi:hypothetical protein